MSAPVNLNYFPLKRVFTLEAPLYWYGNVCVRALFLFALTKRC